MIHGGRIVGVGTLAALAVGLALACSSAVETGTLLRSGSRAPSEDVRTFPEAGSLRDHTGAGSVHASAGHTGTGIPSPHARGEAGAGRQGRTASELQRAVDATPPGDTLVVYGGRYRGPLRLSRPVVLVGRGAPILDGEGEGDVITVAAPGVTVEGFRVRNSGLDLGRNHSAIKVRADKARVRGNRIARSLHGIYLEGVSGAVIERNEISGFDSLASPDRGNGIHLWNSRHNVLLGNVVRTSRDGLYFAGSPSNRISGNTVEGTRIGLHYMYSDSNVFTGNVFRRNEAGAAIMLSRRLEVRGNRFVGNVGSRAYGLLLQTADESTVIENAIEGNTVGLFLDNSNRNHFSGNRVVGNFLGVHLYASAEANRFGANAFAGNEHDLVNDGGRDENDWSPAGRGNYWDAQRGYDLDADGLADAPHRIADVYGGLARKVPSAAIFTRSPALDALALAERLFPAFQADVPVDSRPLAAPPATVKPTAAERHWLLAAGVAPLALSLGVTGLLLLGVARPGLRPEDP
jgi:nitrous oxidase accessory protein